MSRVFIGIGSNEGDRLAAISRAVQALASQPGIRVVQLAPIIETDPVGGPPQGRYLNTVAELDTVVAPRVLFAALKAVERRLGRDPAPARNLPRMIDLDLLLYGDLVVQELDLVVPHPRMHERAFVLEPLAQLAPDVIHPVFRESVAALRDRVAAHAAGAPPSPCN